MPAVITTPTAVKSSTIPVTINIPLPENPVIPGAKDDPNIPKSIPHWYNSRAAEAIIKSTILTILQWTLVNLQTGKWDDWQLSLVYPILSGVFVVVSDMWSGTVKGPFSFQNSRNLDVPVKGNNP